MGKKILPELILDLSNRVPSPFPTAEVESLIFELKGQPLVIQLIANGKLKSPGFKAVERFSLQLSAYINEVERNSKPGETIGDAGKQVTAWREKRKPKREEQKASIARALCNMLEHDPDAGIRQECAKQLRNCNEPFVEEAIKKGAKDADQQVKDECAIFLMKQAWDAK